MNRITKIFLSYSFLFGQTALFCMEMQTQSVLKSEAEPGLLTFTLEDQPYTFSVGSLLKHITRYQKGIDHTGQEKLLGFHHYKPVEIQKLSQEVTLCIVQDNLWVLALGNINTFHKGYVIYQGKVFPQVKTFFPTSWSNDGLEGYIMYLSAVATSSVCIKNYPNTFTKTYKVTLTDPYGQTVYCIINGCPLIPESMHLVTLYPLVTVPEEPEDLSLILSTCAFHQMQRLHVAPKIHILNPELILAVQKNDLVLSDKLLSSGSDTNIQDSKGKTALMYAATTGDWALVNTLLEYGADPSIEDNDGNTALHYGLDSGDYFTALGLINPSLINKANKQSSTPLSIALKNKNIEAVELILQFKPHLSSDAFGRTPLMLALKSYNTKADLAFCKAAIALLLQAGAEVHPQDNEGNTALHYAVKTGSKELVQLLINAHACTSILNSKNENAVTLAKKLNYTAIAILLEETKKEKQAWIEETKGTELMYAVKTENIHELKNLLSQCANVNAHDSYGWTALTYAVETKNSKLVDLLLDAGGDPRTIVFSGSFAENQQNESIIESLQKKSAELNAPLQQQKKDEQSQLKEVLKKFKFEVEQGKLSQETLIALPLFKNKVLNAQRATPLLYAVKEKKHQVAQQLLEHGADLTAVDSENQDAFAYAYTHKDLETLRVLIKFSSYSRIIELYMQSLTEDNSAISLLLCTHVEGLPYHALIKTLTNTNKSLIQKLTTQQLTNTQAGQALVFALEKGNSEAARLIIKSHPQAITYKDTQGMTPLMHSVRQNSLECVQFLIEAGADMYALDNESKSVRDYASSKSPVYQCLLTQEKNHEQAKKQAQENDAKELRKLQLKQNGWSEFAIAVSIGDSEFVKAHLSDAVNAVTPDGDPPLLIAVKHNNENLVTLLVTKSDINVNARDKDGYTALMYAALQDNDTLVALLLNNNAHPCVANNEKATALDLIKSKKIASPLIRSRLQKAQDDIFACYLKKLEDGDSNIVKELQNVLSLPIVFPAAHFTGDSWSHLAMDLLSREYPNEEKLSKRVKFMNSLLHAADDFTTMRTNMSIPLIFLSSANHNNFLPLIKLFIDAGANVNVKDEKGITPLKMALCFGTPEAVRLLLTSSADSNALDVAGNTPLMYAVDRGDSSIVKLLLNFKADVNAKNNNGLTSLMCATMHESIAIIKLLLEADAAIDAQNDVGDTALLYAITQNNKEVTELLLNSGAAINKKNAEGITPLLCALSKKYSQLAHILIQKKADINAQDNEGKTPLMYAANLGLTNIAQYLVRAGADINATNKNQETALMHAVYVGSNDIVKCLLAAGVDVNAQDKEKSTALIYAVDKGDTEIVKLLLNAHANPNLHNRIGRTALIVSVRGRHNTIIPLLLQAKTDVNIQDEDGATAFMYAAGKGNHEAVKLLLQDPTLDTTKEDLLGGNAVRWAITHGQTEIIKLLLKSSNIVDPNSKDRYGFTLLDYALKKGDPEIIQLLHRKK
jgi:serine/threonine-protein phosphatase 6 regulatory ankyrin repeat subunit B